MTTTTTTPAPFISTPEGPGRIDLAYCGPEDLPHVVLEMPCPCSDAVGSTAALSMPDARRLAAEIERLCDTVQPLDREAWAGICKGMGTTIEVLADDAGIDLDTATMEDSYRLARVVGHRLSGKDDVSVEPGRSRS